MIINPPYDILYVDPPWNYQDKRAIGKSRCGAENHYSCIPLNDLCSIPIHKICANNCILYLWASWPLIEDAFALMDAWGFSYHGLGFEWVKINKNGSPFFGIGAYSKSNSEPCLFAKRGKIGMKLKCEKLNDDTMRPVSYMESSLVIEPHERDIRGKIIHSRKPKEVRKRIERLWGDKRRIELFATEKEDGWDAVGFQLGTNIFDVIK